MRRLVLSAVLGLGLANASNLLQKDVFNKLVKSDYPNYCLAKNKYYYLDYKNDFGDYVKTRFSATKAVLGMKEHVAKIEFNRDLDRIYFLAFLVKNNNFFENFFNTSESDKDDEIFYYANVLTSYLRYGGNLGYIPLTNLTLENLQTKRANFKKSANGVMLANGLLNYFASAKSEDEIKKRILLLGSYLFVYTKGDLIVSTFDKQIFETLSVSNSDILIFFLNSILKNTKNPKIQNLIYLLAIKDKNIVKYMLKDKKTKELFKKAIDYYKIIKKC
jgi:succinate dehydrogenase flavin-adding protein (antitoxin of CptAB toxin-antitoxin module)